MNLNGAKIINYKKICSDMSIDVIEKDFKIKIPFYQRPYLWEDEEVNLLIDDFFNAYKLVVNEESTEYFAGAIVTVYNKENTKNGIHEIVDGQQRLTTVFLANYLKYLLLRKILYIIISQKKVSNFESCKINFISTHKNLFIKNDKYMTDIEELLKKYLTIKDSNENKKDDREIEELVKQYVKITGIVVKDIDSDEYCDKVVSANNEYLKNKNLSLCYSRQSYNEELKETLDHVDIKVTSEIIPKIEIFNNYKNGKSPYLNAIVTIFNNVSRRIISDDSLEKSLGIVEELDCFLENLEFCVVQTNNTNDAYTLFEVLNDRGKALTSLDLIKNMYYKAYCDNNRNLENPEIDENISNLEEIWGEKIFDNETIDFRKNLALYMGTVYITGRSNLKYKKDESYIKPLKEKLIEFSYEKIEYNFVIFHICKLIIEEMEIKPTKKNTKVLNVENSLDNSVISKALHLSNALKQYGIMTSLINVIITEYKKNGGSFERDKYEDEFREYIKKIIKRYNANVEEYKNIYIVAKNIRKLIMLSKGHEVPKKYSDMIIKKYFEQRNVTSLDVDIPLSLKMSAEVEFKEWISKWEKGSKNLKVKIFFIILSSMRKEKGKLIKKNVREIFENPELLELDHFEPLNIQIGNKEKYFTLDIERREQYVNQLGNFVLLEKNSNISKSNSPAREAHVYYKKMGIDKNWLIIELMDLFNNPEVCNDKIPTKKFFNIRKNQLINYFISVLNFDLELDETDIIELVKVDEV